MKKNIELKDIPGPVLYLRMCATNKIPVGITLYNETIEKYPEWFPKEIAHKRKWDSIPQSTHDLYWKEFWEFKQKLWENEPKPPGIMGHINNTPEAQAWNEAFNRLYPLEKKKMSELHNKYYKPYGV